jgi:hypothetical protein
MSLYDDLPEAATGAEKAAPGLEFELLYGFHIIL